MKREYITRVRKKSFIIMTLLAPLLVVLFYGIIIYFTVNKDIGEANKVIYVNDYSGLFIDKLGNKKHIQFVYGKAENENHPKEILSKSNIYAVLNIYNKNADSIVLVSNDQPGLSTINYIEKELENVVKNNQLQEYGINQQVLDQINRTNIRIKTVKTTNKGLESGNAIVSTGIGFVSALLIYLFIFLYGVQVMRGVIEEKTNRIVEVIISSVKPFELMMGKITGIALVGLTQFIIWLLLVTVLGGTISAGLLSNAALPSDATTAITQNNIAANPEISGLIQALFSFNFVFITCMFLFYFISGYLFYGALFAAVGSAVDNETDTQQFMLPITIPLVFAFVLAQSVVVADPNSMIAFLLSIVPFTSPIVMMVRIPFGVPVWEIALSMILMIAGFVCTVWLAGRIYRIGILMYGKKISYKEIWKWLFYK